MGALFHRKYEELIEGYDGEDPIITWLRFFFIPLNFFSLLSTSYT